MRLKAQTLRGSDLASDLASGLAGLQVRSLFGAGKVVGSMPVEFCRRREGTNSMFSRLRGDGPFCKGCPADWEQWLNALARAPWRQLDERGGGAWKWRTGAPRKAGEFNPSCPVGCFLFFWKGSPLKSTNKGCCFSPWPLGIWVFHQHMGDEFLEQVRHTHWTRMECDKGNNCIRAGLCCSVVGGTGTDLLG